MVIYSIDPLVLPALLVSFFYFTWKVVKSEFQEEVRQNVRIANEVRKSKPPPEEKQISVSEGQKIKSDAPIMPNGDVSTDGHTASVLPLRRLRTQPERDPDDFRVPKKWITPNKAVTTKGCCLKCHLANSNKNYSLLQRNKLSYKYPCLGRDLLFEEDWGQSQLKEKSLSEMMMNVFGQKRHLMGRESDDDDRRLENDYFAKRLPDMILFGDRKLGLDDISDQDDKKKLKLLKKARDLEIKQRNSYKGFKSESSDSSEEAEEKDEKEAESAEKNQNVKNFTDSEKNEHNVEKNIDLTRRKEPIAVEKNSLGTDSDQKSKSEKNNEKQLNKTDFDIEEGHLSPEKKLFASEKELFGKQPELKNYAGAVFEEPALDKRNLFEVAEETRLEPNQKKDEAAVDLKPKMTAAPEPAVETKTAENPFLTQTEQLFLPRKGTINFTQNDASMIPISLINAQQANPAIPVTQVLFPSNSSGGPLERQQADQPNLSMKDLTKERSFSFGGKSETHSIEKKNSGIQELDDLCMGEQKPLFVAPFQPNPTPVFQLQPSLIFEQQTAPQPQFGAESVNPYRLLSAQSLPSQSELPSIFPSPTAPASAQNFSSPIIPNSLPMFPSPSGLSRPQKRDSFFPSDPSAQLTPGNDLSQNSFMALMPKQQKQPEKPLNLFEPDEDLPQSKSNRDFGYQSPGTPTIRKTSNNTLRNDFLNFSVPVSTSQNIFLQNLQMKQNTKPNEPTSIFGQSTFQSQTSGGQSFNPFLSNR